MIITITMNPSVDLIYLADTFKLGQLNRTKTPAINIGGKGINAGRSAALSGADVTLTGFIGGKIGNLTKSFLEDEKLFNLQMSEVKGETRHAVTIMHDGGVHTEIVEEGPKLEDSDIELLLENVVNISLNNSVSAICICGSANHADNFLFPKMIQYLRNSLGTEIPILVDISGEKLIRLLGGSAVKPDFIKPNEHELGDFIKKSITNKKEAFEALHHSSFEGIKYTVASLGEQGAVCRIQDTYYDVSIPKIEIKSTTGSGDATVGGFAYALEQKFDIEQTLKYAMACGMSNAQLDESGKICRKDVLELTKLISVKVIEEEQQSQSQ
ncbi:1-phosphofructokinase family hexose kinase [Lactovum odontotermitis]